MCSIRTLLSHDGQQVGDAHTHHDCICRCPVKEAAVGSITECLQRPYTNDLGPRVPPWEVEQPSEMLSFSLPPFLPQPLLPFTPPSSFSPLSPPFFFSGEPVSESVLLRRLWDPRSILFSSSWPQCIFFLLHTPPDTIFTPYPHYRSDVTQLGPGTIKIVLSLGSYCCDKLP